MRKQITLSSLFWLLLAVLTITGCAKEDEVTPAPFRQENLMAATWGFTALGSNAINRAGEVAALFTAEELELNGFESQEELREQLSNDFWVTLALGIVEDCTTNNGITFLDSKSVDYDFSDDCGFGSIEPGIFISGATYGWELDGTRLTIRKTITGTGGPGEVTVTEYEVERFSDTNLRLLLLGNDYLTKLGYQTAADPDIRISFDFVVL